MTQTNIFDKPKGKRPDYIAKIANGPNYWLTVGAAWTFTTKAGEEGISIRLKALPPSGELVLFSAKDAEVPPKQLEDDAIPY